VIYNCLPWDAAWFLTSVCLHFLAVPESLDADTWVEASSGHNRLKFNGMGRTEGKTTSDGTEGKIPKNFNALSHLCRGKRVNVKTFDLEGN